MSETEPAILTCPVCATPVDVEVPTEPVDLRTGEPVSVRIVCVTCGADVTLRNVTSETIHKHSIV